MGLEYLDKKILEKYKMKSIACLMICILLVSNLSAQVTSDMVDENGENLKFFGVQGFTVEIEENPALP